MTRGGGVGDGEPVLVGSWYQDSEVTVREVLGIVGVILALVVLGWWLLGPDEALVIGPEAVAEAGGEWPFTVQEVTVQCASDGPIYRFETDGARSHQVSDGIASVPHQLRRTRADGGFVSTAVVSRMAQDFCSS